MYFMLYARRGGLMVSLIKLRIICACFLSHAHNISPRIFHCQKASVGQFNLCFYLSDTESIELGHW
jgi:hypothetical protein